MRAKQKGEGKVCRCDRSRRGRGEERRRRQAFWVREAEDGREETEEMSEGRA